MRDALTSQFESIQSRIDGRYDLLKSTVAETAKDVNKKRKHFVQQANHQWNRTEGLREEVRSHSQKLFDIARVGYSRTKQKLDELRGQ